MKNETYLINGMTVTQEEYTQVMTQLFDNDQLYTVTIVNAPAFKIFHLIGILQ